MAGRIRSIKPEILEDEKTAELDHESWRVFVSLFLVADDYGNCRAKASFLQGQILHSTDARDFRETLARLSELSLITLYEVRGQQYLHITNWEKHQKVDKPGKPRVPGPELAETEEKRKNSRDSRETSSRPSRLTPTTTPTYDQDHEGEGDQRARPPQTPPPPEVRRFEESFTPKPKPAELFPADFEPSPANVEQAKSAGLDLKAEVAELRDYARQHGRVSCDWQADLSRWLRKAVKFRREDEERQREKSGGRARTREAQTAEDIMFERRMQAKAREILG